MDQTTRAKFEENLESLNHHFQSDETRQIARDHMIDVMINHVSMVALDNLVADSKRPGDTITADCDTLKSCIKWWGVYVRIASTLFNCVRGMEFMLMGEKVGNPLNVEKVIQEKCKELKDEFLELTIQNSPNNNPEKLVYNEMLFATLSHICEVLEKNFKMKYESFMNKKP